MIVFERFAGLNMGCVVLGMLICIIFWAQWKYFQVNFKF